MEEDVERKDEDGVDGRGVCGWDGWVCGLGAVGASSIFGLVRRAGDFAAVLPTFVLVTRLQLAQLYRGNGHFLSAVSSSRHDAMVGGALARASALRVGLGVGGVAISSGSRARLSHSCDGWVCDLGAVGASSIFWLIRGAGAFAAVLPTFVFSFKNAARATVPWKWPLPQPSPLDRALAHRIRGFLACSPHLYH